MTDVRPGQVWLRKYPEGRPPEATVVSVDAEHVFLEGDATAWCTSVFPVLFSFIRDDSDIFDRLKDEEPFRMRPEPPPPPPRPLTAAQQIAYEIDLEILAQLEQAAADMPKPKDAWNLLEEDDA